MFQTHTPAPGRLEAACPHNGPIAVPRLGFETLRERRAESAGFKRILVAVDSSEHSHFAVDAAAQLCQQLDAEVVLHHAADE